MPRIFPDRIPSGRRFRASTEGKDRTKARVRPPTAPASEEHPNGRSALRRLAVWMRIVNFVRTNDRTMTSYLQAEGLTKSFGERVLFENLSLAVGEGQRIGLIAKNGTGKTTLLNILAGKEDYEAGRITRRRDLKIAYLEQDPKLPAGKTVLDACLTGDSPALRAIAAYELALGSGDEESLHRAMAEMDARQAWNYESQVKQILTRLRITDYAQPTEQLSGGQVKRVALARRADSRAGATDSGRTDEPPRPRDDRMARGLPLPLADEPADGHARPLLSGSRMHRYRRARRPHDLLLQGQLQPLSGKAATAARRGGRPTRARREPLSQGARLDATATAGTRHESPVRGSSRSASSKSGCASAGRAETSASTRKQPISVRKYSRSAGYASGSATGSSSTDWTTVSLATRKWASSATTARASRLSSGCCWGWSRPTRERSTSARRSASAIMRNKGSRSTRTRK